MGEDKECGEEKRVGQDTGTPLESTGSSPSRPGTKTASAEVQTPTWRAEEGETGGGGGTGIEREDRGTAEWWSRTDVGSETVPKTRPEVGREEPRDDGRRHRGGGPHSGRRRRRKD